LNVINKCAEEWRITQIGQTGEASAADNAAILPTKVGLQCR